MTDKCKHEQQDEKGLYYCDVEGHRIHSRKPCGFFTLLCPNYDREMEVSRSEEDNG